LTDSSSLSGDAGGGCTADCWNPDPYPSVVSSSNVNNRAAENQERFASANMLSSKAQAGTYNIGVRMAVMEELERGLNLLEKIRGCIGEDKSTDGVHDVYPSLPKYGTFKNEVKVIDVDNDDDPPRDAAQKEANNSGNIDSSDDDDSNDEDADGGTDLEKMFPNVPGNDVEYVYTRNASGRVIAVDCRLKKGKKQGTTTNGVL
jgi:hypothetical protein